MPKKPSGFQSASLSSPDGQTCVKITLRERIEPYPSGKRLYYSVIFKGREILVDSPLGMDFRYAPPLAKNLALIGKERRPLTRSGRWCTANVEIS
jgi:hypothetical protein